MNNSILNYTFKENYALGKNGSSTWEPKCNMHEKFNIKGDGKIKKTT